MVCVAKDIPLMEAATQAINMMHLSAIAVTEEKTLTPHCAHSLIVVFRLLFLSLLLAHPLDVIWWLQVPAVAHSFLTRGVHMGALIMTCVAMQDLRVPIIPIDDLCYFFAADQVSTI